LNALINKECARLGITLPEGATDRLLAFRDRLLDENQRLNLTAITDPQEAVHKHLVDSLASLALDLPTGDDKLWMDVGSGGGLPGLALALACPGPRLVLVEATGKKAAFLTASVAQFKLAPRVSVMNARAEVLGQDPAWRAKADVVFFKAVGSMAELLELGLPLLKPGGLMVAYKGPKAEEELALAGRALQLLQGKVETVRPYSLGWQDDQRCLVAVRKTGPTPKQYPRPAGMPKKAPLL